MNDLALSKGNHTKQGWMIQYLKKKKNPPITHSLLLDFPSPQKKALHTQVKCEVLRHTIYYQTTSCSYCVMIVAAFKVHAFLTLLKM